MPRIETILAQSGCDPQPPTFDLVNPLHLATTYERAADGAYPGGYKYTRNDNPTRSQFQTVMARLEGGADASAFSSGMAASTALLQGLRPRDHVVIPDDVYYGVRRLVLDVFEPWGLDFTEADFTQPERVAEAIQPNTRLLWAETPSNPLAKITDLAAIADLAHDRGARLVVDSTWTTPLLQRPLDLGADIVLHSVTKYLAGHTDVLGGVLITKKKDELWRRIVANQATAGAVMDPFSAWLAMRGLRSLSARMSVHCRNALAVAAALEAHRDVEAVHYPGLTSHPGHEVAGRQMSGFGGMLSFQVPGGEREGLSVAARTRVFKRATSLGGTESLIEHRASTEVQPSPTPDNLLRLSVGLEHVDDLIEDLQQALAG